MERFGDDDAPALVAEEDAFRAYQVRWPVLEGVHGEGLLLEPKRRRAGLMSSPFPTRTRRRNRLRASAPASRAGSQFARRLAANGFRVVVPTLVSRGITFSGNPRIAMTNQSHREWIYRQAYQMGRHVDRLRGAEGPGRGGLDREAGGAGREGRRRRLRRRRA